MYMYLRTLKRVDHGTSLLQYTHNFGPFKLLFKIKLEMDDTARSYRAHFLGYEHYNLCGTDDNLGPVVVSVKTYSDLESRSKKGTSVDEESVQVK